MSGNMNSGAVRLITQPPCSIHGILNQNLVSSSSRNVFPDGKNSTSSRRGLSNFAGSLVLAMWGHERAVDAVIRGVRSAFSAMSWVVGDVGRCGSRRVCEAQRFPSDFNGCQKERNHERLRVAAIFRE